VLALKLPPRSELFMNNGYTDYTVEDAASEADRVRLLVCRKQIKTAFSKLTRLFAKRIHTGTLKELLMKAFFIKLFTLD
jgi:hypothetical protein